MFKKNQKITILNNNKLLTNFDTIDRKTQNSFLNHMNISIENIDDHKIYLLISYILYNDHDYTLKWADHKYFIKYDINQLIIDFNNKYLDYIYKNRKYVDKLLKEGNVPQFITYGNMKMNYNDNLNYYVNDCDYKLIEYTKIISIIKNII